MKKNKKNAADAAKTREAKDLTILQNMSAGHYGTYSGLLSDSLEDYCCYECYIVTLKERIAWLIMENIKLKQGQM